jgi:hypothetical protein
MEAKGGCSEGSTNYAGTDCMLNTTALENTAGVQ